MIWDWLSVGLKAAAFALVLQAIGGSLFGLRYGHDELLSLNKLVGFATVTGVVVIAASQWIEPARLAASQSGLFDRELQQMLLVSPFGQSNALRIAGLGFIALSWFGSGNSRLLLVSIGITASVVSFAWVGHTSTHGLGIILALALMFHVGIAAFWFGSLLPLSRSIESLPNSEAAEILDRFSRDAFWLVPIIGLIGLVMAIALSTSVSALLTTGYGQLLLFKLALFATLLGFAARNKIVLVPALSGGDKGVAQKLQRSIRSEFLLIVVVLVTTATLTSFFAPPGAD